MQEVRELLASWKPHLLAAAYIFVYAPSANGKTLFGSAGDGLSRDDTRIRGIPFSIRRPTFKEAKRVAEVLAELDYRDPQGQAAEPNLATNTNPVNTKLDRTDLPGTSMLDASHGNVKGSQPSVVREAHKEVPCIRAAPVDVDVIDSMTAAGNMDEHEDIVEVQRATTELHQASAAGVKPARSQMLVRSLFSNRHSCSRYSCMMWDVLCCLHGQFTTSI